jgi:hypothetical protein
MKYLVLIILAWAALNLWRRIRRGNAPVEASSSPAGEFMASCAHCGVYAPLSDMVNDAQGRHYCSIKHKKMGEMR